MAFERVQTFQKIAHYYTIISSLSRTTVIFFREGHEEQALQKEANKNPMLSAWFELNKTDPESVKLHYSDVPKQNTTILWEMEKEN